MFELGLHQFPGVKTLAADPTRPVASGKKPHQVKLAGLEGFQPGGVVLVDFHGDAVEIVDAALYVEVFRPVAGVAHIGNVLAKAHRANFVGPAADRDIRHHLVKRFWFAILHAPLTAKHWQATHREGKPPVRLLETVAHGSLIHDVHASHIFQQAFVRR